MKLDQQRAVVEADRRRKRLTFREERPIAGPVSGTDGQLLAALQRLFRRVMLIGDERAYSAGRRRGTGSGERRPEQCCRDKECAKNPPPSGQVEFEHFVSLRAFPLSLRSTLQDCGA